VQWAVQGSPGLLAWLDQSVNQVDKDHQDSLVSLEIVASPEQPVRQDDLDQLEQLAILGQKDQLEDKASLANKVFDIL